MSWTRVQTQIEPLPPLKSQMFSYQNALVFGVSLKETRYPSSTLTPITLGLSFLGLNMKAIFWFYRYIDPGI